MIGLVFKVNLIDRYSALSAAMSVEHLQLFKKGNTATVEI